MGEKAIEQLDAVAHMFPSDLQKFKTRETFATAFSVAMGSPDERSVPLFTAEQMREYGVTCAAAEREACAAVVECFDACDPKHIAAAIRARRQ